MKGEHEYMIPAVDEFLAETNVEGGYIKVRLIELFHTSGFASACFFALAAQAPMPTIRAIAYTKCLFFIFFS